MTAGLPVIVPTQGGIAEMVEEGKNGFKIDIQELDSIVCHIEQILTDKNHYERMAYSALDMSKRYSLESMLSEINKTLWTIT